MTTIESHEGQVTHQMLRLEMRLTHTKITSMHKIVANVSKVMMERELLTF